MGQTSKWGIEKINLGGKINSPEFADSIVLNYISLKLNFILENLTIILVSCFPCHQLIKKYRDGGSKFLIFLKKILIIFFT